MKERKEFIHNLQVPKKNRSALKYLTFSILFKNQESAWHRKNRTISDICETLPDYQLLRKFLITDSILILSL